MLDLIDLALSLLWLAAFCTLRRMRLRRARRGPMELPQVLVLAVPSYELSSVDVVRAAMASRGEVLARKHR